VLEAKASTDDVGGPRRKNRIRQFTDACHLHRPMLPRPWTLRKRYGSTGSMGLRMNPVGVVDLTGAMAQAAELSRLAGQPLVIAGALALAAHGYQRQTTDVDIVVPVVIGAASGDALEAFANDIGLTVRAKHGFGGLDLRAGPIRIDVLTLDRDLPELIPEAVAEAVASDRRAEFFGHDAFVVSLGHLITMKLLAERKKDIGDVVELIKARIELGEWGYDERRQVRALVTEHLGAEVTLAKLAAVAREELEPQ
jgi:hypothetical protein